MSQSAIIRSRSGRPRLDWPVVAYVVLVPLLRCGVRSSPLSILLTMAWTGGSVTSVLGAGQELSRQMHSPGPRAYEPRAPVQVRDDQRAKRHRAELPRGISAHAGQQIGPDSTLELVDQVVHRTSIAALRHEA